MTISVIDRTALATEITAAWLSNPNNRPSQEEAARLLQESYEAIGILDSPPGETVPVDTEETYTPAVSVRKSLASKDHILSLIDGKPYRSLRRHLAAHGLTPDQYRQRYGLKEDYPMVAESYSKERREMALKIGLGKGGRKPVKK